MGWGMRFGTGAFGQAAANLLHGAAARKGALARQAEIEARQAETRSRTAHRVRSTIDQALEAVRQGRLDEARRLLGRAEIEAGRDAALMAQVQKAKDEISSMPDIWTGNPKIDRHIAKAMEMVRSAYPGVPLEKEALERAMWPVKAAAARQSIETMAQQAGFVGPDGPARFLAHRIERKAVSTEHYKGQFAPSEGTKVHFPGPEYTTGPVYLDYEFGFDTATDLGVPDLAPELVDVFYRVRTRMGIDEAVELRTQAMQFQGDVYGLKKFHEQLRTLPEPPIGPDLKRWFDITSRFGWNPAPAQRPKKEA